MPADFPPSSSVTRLRLAPQAAAIFLPTALDPVNATMSIPGCATRAAPVASPPVTMLTTPAGMPALVTAWARK
jgi:hypothetical protein